MPKASTELVAMIERALAADPKAALIAARCLGEEVEWLQHRAVAQARFSGYNWGQIGRLLGLTRQGARKKFPTALLAPAPHVITRDTHLERERQAEAAIQKFRDAHAAGSSSISQQS